MTRLLAMLTCWGGLALPLVAQDKQEYRPTPRPLQGVVHGPDLFAVARRPGKHSDTFYLLQGLLLPGKQKDPAMTAYDLQDAFDNYSYPLAFYPWRLQQDCFWSRGAQPMSEYALRIPREHWKFLDARTYEKEGWKELLKLYEVPAAYHHILTEPAKEVHWELLRGRGPLPSFKENEMVGDYLPGENLRGVLFTLVGRQMTAWRGKGSAQRKPAYWEFSWEKEEPFAAGFQEPFQALEWRGDWCFLTQSGKLYWSARPAPGQARRCVPAWADAGRPVTALLTDADAGRTFLFCTEKGKAPDTYQAYFELGPRPTPLPVKQGAIPAPAREANPLEMVRPLARFLIAQEHIRPK